MLELNKLVEQVGEWSKHNFGDVDAVHSTLGMCEEAGEIARAVLKQDQGIRGTYKEWDDECMKEIGDVVIKLAELCDIQGYDFERVVAERWGVVRKRDWQADKLTGGGHR